MQTERYPAVVTSIEEDDKIFTVFVRDIRYNLDFGPNGRLHGACPSFQNYHVVQGFSRRRRAGDYKNFGKKGIVEGTKLWIYHIPGTPQMITYIMPRVERTRGWP